jgi:uncharacterized protein YdaU (DUF1376 family)
MSRTYFARFFPERAFFVIDRLTEREAVAWLRLSGEYVLHDGQLPDDDKVLSRLVKLPLRSWHALRAKLLAAGLARVTEGRWIDDDQDANLRIQRASRERSRTANAARWSRTRGARDEA